jgi:hypothetical protein
MVRVVLRVRSKFGEREREFLFFWRRCGGSLASSFFFRLFSLFRVFLLLLLFGGWRRTHTTPQTTPRREKKEGEVRKRVLLPLLYYVRTAPITPFSFSLSLSFSQSLSENLVFAFAVKKFHSHRGEKNSRFGEKRAERTVSSTPNNTLLGTREVFFFFFFFGRFNEKQWRRRRRNRRNRPTLA